MSLTNEEKELVSQSFFKVSADVDQAAKVFYDRLFEISPDTYALFQDTDMQKQGRILMQMLDRVVESLYQRDPIEDEMKALGKRHIQYGVDVSQYQFFGEALLGMLEQILGRSFTPELQAAWKKAFQLMARLALEGVGE